MASFQHPDHMKGNTSKIWMWHRRSGNKNWIMEGIRYVVTDETGRYKNHQLSEMYELHVQENQLVILHHPNCKKDQVTTNKFLSKVRKHLEKIYEDLKDMY